MIIKNQNELATSKKREGVLKILEAGLQAANPERIITEYVTPTKIKIGSEIWDITKYSAIYTVAFGKAGDSMTRAVNNIIPVKSGIIVIPKGSKSIIKGKKFRIFNSRHPKPDKTSVKAAKEVMKFVENKRSDELIIFLISGGGSSLLAMPDKITLEDKIYVTDVLLRSGATIQEFNCIRKHLSRIKGGRLVEKMKCAGIGLVMSDVQGDDMSSIASGPTHMDDTTYADALQIIEKYKIRTKTPTAVLQVLREGKELEKNKETPKKIKMDNRIIASNNDCLNAMQNTAEQLGYQVRKMQVFGDIKDVVKELLKEITDEENKCIIFGGESTLRVLGKGMGGRNQELVLRMLKNTQKLGKKVVIASMGTDGIDGNSVFAGAITDNIKVDADTVKEFLKNSDSGRYFQKQKNNIITGPTRTNLMDIGVILK